MLSYISKSIYKVQYVKKSCRKSKYENLISGNPDISFYILYKLVGTGLNMSNNTQSWRIGQDWYMSQVFSFGKFFLNCTVLAATTKMSRWWKKIWQIFQFFTLEQVLTWTITNFLQSFRSSDFHFKYYILSNKLKVCKQNHKSKFSNSSHGPSQGKEVF